MTDTHDPQEVIRRLAQWAEQRPSVRAVLLTSTRANPNAPVDVFSDYDVVLVVQDIHPFFDDRTWLQGFGEVLVVYWDPLHPDLDYGIERVENVTHYAEGFEIDFNLWPVELFRRVAAAPVLPAELDVGYAVLCDKDNLTAKLPAPTHTAYVPTPPAHDVYQTAIQDFFSSAPYVAKCLWRDELLPAKWCLDLDMKHNFLRLMLEWRMELDHHWSVPTGALGKGLKKRLPADLWQQLEQTYVGADIADNWEALFRTMALFRRVATEVGEQLGYAYPHDLDRRVTDYVQSMQRRGRAGLAT